MTPSTLLQQLGRQTKIVCTIGPASNSEAQIQQLIQTGMNVVRLNFSHGSPEEHGLVIRQVRRLAVQLGTPVAILQDLAGPKVRIGSFTTGAVDLTAGDSFTLTTRAVEGDHSHVSVSYPLLPTEVESGETLLLNDGVVELQVQKVTDTDIHCRVIVGGRLSAHKGVNCPSGLFSLPILGERDLQDLQFGVSQGVDYVGLSFVRTADDVRTARAELAKLGSDIPIIAKIETQTALSHLDSILTEADGLMIARGDLGIETPFSRVPLVQKQIIAKTNQQAKPVITATHMLRSMVESPRPSRAEAADVANAVLDGSDALMLSEETAVGHYPVRAVQTMAAIAIEAEKSGLLTTPEKLTESIPYLHNAEAVTQAACAIAMKLRADAIVTVTLLGITARLVAKYRPSQPIMAATPRPETYRRLALVRGVTSLLLPEESPSREVMIQTTKQLLREQGFQGKKIVVVSSISPDQNLLTTDVL